MSVCVIPDDMSLGVRLSDQLWISCDTLANPKERGVDAELPQHLQHERRVLRIRTVVEGQANLRMLRIAPDHQSPTDLEPPGFLQHPSVLERLVKTRARLKASR